MEEWGNRGLTVFELLFSDFSQPAKYAKSSERIYIWYLSKCKNTSVVMNTKTVIAGGRLTAEVAGHTF